MKAKLGMRKVRPWKWMPFTNPARRDGLVLYHWRRAAEKGQDYAFAKFNKRLEVLTAEFGLVFCYNLYNSYTPTYLESVIF